jgi:hypothetical protein
MILAAGLLLFFENPVMKRLWICAVFLAGLSVACMAQPKANKKLKSTAVRSSSARLESSNSNAAYAPAASPKQFSISDPVVNLYNGRASGVLPTNHISRPVFGMPKLRYGVANGHLLFYNTTATTSGSYTGGGSVGTGSSAGSVGTNGVAPGVNGKNPYAGPGIYGNRVRLSGQPINLPPSQTGSTDQKPW